MHVYTTQTFAYRVPTYTEDTAATALCQSPHSFRTHTVELATRAHSTASALSRARPRMYVHNARWRQHVVARPRCPIRTHMQQCLLFCTLSSFSPRGLLLESKGGEGGVLPCRVLQAGAGIYSLHGGETGDWVIELWRNFVGSSRSF